MEYNNEYINAFEQYEGYTYPSTETRNINFSTYKYVPFNIKEIKRKDGNILYVWEYICLKLNEYNYEGLIKELIFRKYADNSDIIAITLNYMSDPTNDKYKKEFEELQAYRKEVKDFAKKYFKM